MSRVGVVGGGAVGLATALSARRAGLDVTVFERRTPGFGASGHNGGIFSLGNCLPTSTPDVLARVPKMLLDPLSPLAVSWTYLPRLAPWLARFVLAGRPRRIEEISQALAALLARAVDAYLPLIDAGALLRPGGHLIGFETERSFAASHRSIDVRRRRGVALEVLGPEDIAHLDPGLAGRFARGVLIEGAPYVDDPRQVVMALAERLRAEGGEIVEAEVTGFEQRAGRVVGVRVGGERREVDAVVLAAGAWSRRLAAELGDRVPLDTERGYGVELPHAGAGVSIPFISADHHIAVTPAGGERLRIVGTDELAGLRKPPNLARADKLVEVTRRILPHLDDAGRTVWMSFRPSLPDSLPVIGKASGAENAFHAFGHGHTGFTTAAVTGRLVVSLLTGQAPEVDLTPFRPTRFRRRAS